MGCPVDGRYSWQQTWVTFWLPSPCGASCYRLALRLELVARHAYALQLIRRDTVTSTSAVGRKVALVVKMIELSGAAWEPQLALVVVPQAHGAQHDRGHGALASSSSVRFPCHPWSSLPMGGCWRAAVAQ